MTNLTIIPIELLDTVALTDNLPQNALVRGQVGTIVEILAPDVYEVEFSDDDGQTYAMLTLHANQLMRLYYFPINATIAPDNLHIPFDITAMTHIHQNGQGNNFAGDQVNGNKIGTQISGPAVGIVSGDNAQVHDNTFTQINNATTAELLALIAQLRQTTTQLPKDIQEDLTIDLDDIETEIQKPADQRSLPKLKKRLGALIATIGIATAPIAASTDFANTALDLGSKLGIELPTAP
jgi:hypothetical protein